MSGLDLADPRTQRVVQAVALGLGIAFAVMSYHGSLLWTDGQAYWNAAERLRAGLDLYPSGVDQESADIYRYAPWFAWAWVPLTFLPEPLVAALWTVLVLVAWGLPVRAFLAGTWSHRAAAFLAGPPLLIAALGGNVQPAVVALLWAFLDRRWGPAAVGVAASLKLFPALFAVTYLARREWGRALTAIVIAALLWLPVLASGADSYPSAVGGALSLWAISPFAYVAAIAAAGVWALRRPSWLPASVLVLVGASVRFIPYQLGYLLCSAPRPAGQTATRASGSSTEASTG
jgi:hypothetical protein